MSTPTNRSRASVTTFDLMVCRGDRIVAHHVAHTPAGRMQTCLRVLQDTTVLRGALPADLIDQVTEYYHELCRDPHLDPDQVVNALAAMVRPWKVHVYVSTAERPRAPVQSAPAPRTLFSVITTYGPGQVAAEHFPTRKARASSLLERTGVPSPSWLDACPFTVIEQYLLEALGQQLSPTTLSLTEARWDFASQAYRPVMDDALASLR